VRGLVISDGCILPRSVSVTAYSLIQELRCLCPLTIVRNITNTEHTTAYTARCKLRVDWHSLVNREDDRDEGHDVAAGTENTWTQHSNYQYYNYSNYYNCNYNYYNSNHYYDNYNNYSYTYIAGTSIYYYTVTLNLLYHSSLSQNASLP